MKKCIYLLLVFQCFNVLSNNDSTSNQYNIHSNYMVSERDILWRRTVWRSFDLREPRNEGFYASESEITKSIINAAQNGTISIYTSDSLSYGRKMSTDQFNENLICNQFESLFTEEDLLYLENNNDYSTLVINENSQDTLGAHDLYQIEIKEELIFDSKHSRLISDILSFRLILSADHPLNIYGVDKTIGVFSFKELSDKVFSSKASVKYYMAKNLSKPINFDQAIKMNYHYAPISKLNNSQNLYLSDQCDCSTEELLWKSLELEYNIKEYELRFWKTK